MSPSRRLLTLLIVLAALSVIPLASSQAAMSVSVSTNKTQYQLGETVGISGKVIDSQGGPIMGVAVSVQVGDPPKFIEVVYTDSSGAYSVSYILGSNFAPGQYTVYATANRAGYTTAQQQTQFTIPAQTASTRTSSTSQGAQASQCFIATATYGSEISPEVALLRSFRDAEVMQTLAGSGFMQAFNDFYYSFSPQVASLIASHEILRAVMKVVLYPLIAILYVSSLIFQTSSLNGEFAVTLSGIFAATGIGFVYFSPIAILSGRLSHFSNDLTRSIWKIVLAGCGTSTVALTIIELAGLSDVLSWSAVAVVLSYLVLGMLCAKSASARLGWKKVH